MFSWIIGWKEKLIGAGVAILLVIGWLLKFRWTSEQRGAQKVKDQIAKDNKKVTDAWAKIDAAPRGVDDALGRLRKRSTQQGYRPEP